MWKLGKRYPLLSALDCHLLDSCVLTTVWKMLLRFLISEVVHNFILSFSIWQKKVVFSHSVVLVIVIVIVIVILLST